ncbi:UPF0182 family protein [Phormidium sp. FACHB-322]|uniref:UPF0182 family protein n=2 Tax=Cyanobacteriota TaxID=1117 RepID=UPI0016856ACE|nr:UPF0182 family protein [Leptolyngbya sp. FACHB-60]MBD1919291.1 UPF0182 family protein [Phormidium sp. FACHB-77]MBD2033010.1 UPF0182 family protein [Phormidium sp. FACHB-322]MBD2054198.1 UPF0182 family protein [Leptolyngbya sp. FACHB-60]
MMTKAFAKSLPRWGWLGLGLGLLTLLFFDAIVNLQAERLWFEEVNYLEVFWLRLRSQLILGIIPILCTLGFTWGNLTLADRTQPLEKPSDRPNQANSLGLSGLLLVGITLSFLIGLQLLYQGQIAGDFWRQTTTLYDSTTPLALWPKLQLFKVVGQIFITQPWLLIALGISTVAFLLYPRQLGRLAAMLMSLGYGLILAKQWPAVLLALDPVPYGQTEPIFNRDIAFYIFRLPVLRLLEFWVVGGLFFTLVSVCLVYLLRDNTLSQGRFYGFSSTQRQHLYSLAGLLFLATSISHWLGRYDVLYSGEGVVYGADYTHVNVVLPANWLLSIFTLGLGLVFLSRGLLWAPTYINPIRKSPLAGVAKAPLGWGAGLGRASLLVKGICGYLVLTLLGLVLVPTMVQRLVVQPNELQRERPYIANSIALTRAAFDLEAIESEPFDPSGDLNAEDLEQNDLTLENIRLWDPRPLLDSNRQLQQIRLYYEFKDADFDRYSILNQQRRSERRQVMISARELNYERVPEIAKTWVNEHLVYTHGYGFTMSPVNTAGLDGLPTYFVSGINNLPSSEEVRQSIPIGEPRLYFGELTDTYIMTNTQVPELDYPSGNENIYTTYLGRGGINLESGWRRLLFARYLLDWRMLFTEDFTADTRLLFRRNIADRVRAIAPFLRFDTDPYLVAADIGNASRQWGTGAVHGSRPPSRVNFEEFRARDPNLTIENYDSQETESYLYWVIDAYTVSGRYPYSDPDDNDFNYIRNSVKVVIDAYNGAISFFVADPNDPIIQTWSRLLPDMFESLETMPESLRAHIRYPQDLFSVQADSLMTYHMTDPQVFYNREDQWRAPSEIYASESQQVDPYYLIMKLPQEDTEEFVLLRLFTPAQRNNLIAWLAARSDGDRYGLRLLYQFPKQELVFGPEQIEARINQDPEISQRISLWDTQGSQAQQGNLLVIPIEQSLIYVEPLYLVAEQNQLPTLTRVILVYKNRIAMAPTLQAVLSAVFLEEPEPAAPILRELGAEPPEADQPLQPPPGIDIPTGTPAEEGLLEGG